MTLVKDILSAKPPGVYAVTPTDSVSHVLALLREHVMIQGQRFSVLMASLPQLQLFAA